MASSVRRVGQRKPEARYYLSKAIAAEHNIPMVENIELARALAKETEIGRAITPNWFRAVAEILAAVYKLRRGAA